MRKLTSTQGGRALVVIAAAALAAAAAFILTALPRGFGIPCIFNLITGLYCPGCGGTRALRALMELDFYQAFRWNPLLTALLPFIGAYFAALAASWILYAEDRVTRRLRSKYMWWLLAAVLLFGLMRNLQWFAFLAPTAV